MRACDPPCGGYRLCRLAGRLFAKSQERLSRSRAQQRITSAALGDALLALIERARCRRRQVAPRLSPGVFKRARANSQPARRGGHAHQRHSLPEATDRVVVPVVRRDHLWQSGRQRIGAWIRPEPWIVADAHASEEQRIRARILFERETLVESVERGLAQCLWLRVGVVIGAMVGAQRRQRIAQQTERPDIVDFVRVSPRLGYTPE